MMMMMMMMMVDVVVLVISASDNRWGSLVGLGRARRDDRGAQPSLSCEKSMSQSIVRVVGGWFCGVGCSLVIMYRMVGEVGEI